MRISILLLLVTFSELGQCHTPACRFVFGKTEDASTVDASTEDASTVDANTVDANKNNGLNILETIKQTKVNHPHLKGLQQAVRGKKSSLNASFSPFLPSASVTASGIKVKDLSEIKSSFKLSASQNIIDLPSVALHTAAKNTHHLSELTRRLGQDNVRSEAEKTFLGAWLFSNKDKYIKSLASSAQSLFEQDKLKSELGLTKRSSFLKSTAVYADNIRTVQQYDNDLDNSFIALENATGLVFRSNSSNEKPSYSELQWNVHENVELPDLSKVMTQAIKNRKEFSIKDEEIDIAKENEKYYLNGYTPKIWAAGSYTDSKSGTAGESSVSTHDAGIYASWNCFDGLLNYHNSQAQLAEQVRLQEERAYWSLKIKSQVSTAYQTMEIEIRDLKEFDIELSEQQLLFDEITEQFKAGLITKTSFLAAEKTFEKSKFTWLEHRTNVSLAKYDLDSRCGFPESSL
jgi:outer membrane protein TolC